MTNKYSRMPKRVFDVIGAIVLLVILSPLMLITALLVKWSSPGPILFVQPRVGLNGALFNFLKFRTMFIDVEPMISIEAQRLASQGILLKVKNDPRVTSPGRILRKYSLDELPQLINVLRGEMSLVGPRPLIPFMLDHDQPLKHARSIVKPGLTGYWQIRARDQSSSASQMWEFDQAYIREISFATDVRVLASTIPNVLRGRGAK